MQILNKFRREFNPRPINSIEPVMQPIDLLDSIPLMIDISDIPDNIVEAGAYIAGDNDQGLDFLGFEEFVPAGSGPEPAFGECHLAVV
jgi:hypothetical protein